MTRSVIPIHSLFQYLQVPLKPDKEAVFLQVPYILFVHYDPASRGDDKIVALRNPFNHGFFCLPKRFPPSFGNNIFDRGPGLVFDYGIGVHEPHIHLFCNNLSHGGLAATPVTYEYDIHSENPSSLLFRLFGL